MRKIEIDIEDTNLVSSTIVSKFLNVSEEYVRQLGDSGKLSYEREEKGKTRRFDLIPTINTYIEYWKNKANKIESTLSDEERRIKADADWKEAKADIEAMKRDELKGSLHSSDDVAEITGDMVMAIRAAILAIPGMCAVDCASADNPKETTKILKDAIYEILDGLSEYEYNPDKYKELVRERESWLSEDSEA